MATETQPITIGRETRSLLRRLRHRIRLYVWLDGLSLAVVWIGLTFWIGLAIDYLPVLVGASEMPRVARMLLLGVIAAVLAYVLYRWIGRRAFRRLPDHSLAILLERRFGHFHDELVTAVEMAEQPEHARQFNPEMLAQTSRTAQALSGNLRVGEVFRVAPLAGKAIVALVLVGSIAGMYALNRDALETWVNRLYLLADVPWPRSTHIEVVGVQVQHTSPIDGAVTLSELQRFGRRHDIKVAKGASVLLKVRADATKVVPEYCTVYYDTDGDERGQVNMQKLGRIQDDYQLYAFDGKPFHGILSTILFDVRGNDHRVRDYRLTVVPNPTVVDTQLECVFPSYMVNERLSLWLPRTVPLASGTQLPIGTRVTLHAKTNKDLTHVDVHDLLTDETVTVHVDDSATDRRTFTYVVDRLPESLTLEVTLHDTDGVSSDPPTRMFIAGVADQPPSIDAVLSGIGSAVTPQVVVPATGKILDDYDVAEAWFDVIVNDSEPRRFAFSLDTDGSVDAQLDFREQRSDSEKPLELLPKDKLSLTVMAADHCDLGDQPNAGSGDRYQLEVVTPDELLALLDRKELGLRRRFEQIIDELNQLRDSLNRIHSRPDDPRGLAPEDASKEAPDAEPDGDGKTKAERSLSLRVLRTQQAIVQSQKSSQEIQGVATSFRDVRQELINNRVDTEDRKTRLQEQIADPLQAVVDTLFPEFDRRLLDLQSKTADVAASDLATDSSVAQLDDILIELDKVLQKMLELETFNELVNLVRSLIEDQQQLLDKTKSQRVNQARELLK